jgi:hypothetical protein
MKQFFLEGKTTQGHECKTVHFPQITMAIDFSQLKSQGLAKNLFVAKDL